MQVRGPRLALIVGAWVLLALAAALALASARPAWAAEETPAPVVINIPPYPTQIPYPTVVAKQGATGLAVVSVGSGPGADGRLDLIAAICLFGFTMLVILEVCQLVILRRR